jgi:tetratricopeptide (TPR) repeat protein
MTKHQRALLLLGLAVLFSGAAASAADSAAADWRKALGLYKQKQFDEACPLFESAATAKKTNGAIWGDLGLCELKRGEPSASVRASTLAVRFGGEKVRLAAYYNLRAASFAIELPKSGCALLPSTAGLECKKSIAVCQKHWENFGTGQATNGEAVYFADSVEQAESLAQEVLPPSYRDSIRSGLVLSEEQQCFSWCARHPEYDCTDTCKEGPLLSCTLVSLDACHRRAGYVCAESDEPGGRARRFADEYEFPEESP